MWQCLQSRQPCRKADCAQHAVCDNTVYSSRVSDMGPFMVPLTALPACPAVQRD